MAKYNFLNYFRARRFYVMLSIVLIIGTILTVVVGYYGPDSFGGGLGALISADARARAFYGAAWGSFVILVLVLSAAFFAGDAISGEFQNKTGYFLVPNPIRRSVIYAGKYIAALLAASIILGTFAVFIFANGLYYFGSDVPVQFLESVAFSWVFLAATLSLSFAFSSLFRSSAISVLMSVIVYVFVFNVIDTVVGVVANSEPWFTLSYGASIIRLIFTVPYPPHLAGSLANRFGFSPFNPTVPEGLAIAGGYFLVMGVVGLWLFEKKEFTG